MRWIFWLLFSCVLVIVTGVVWNNRFAGVPNGALVCFGEGGGGAGFSLEKKRGGEPIARVASLPFSEAVDMVHVRIGWRAVDLVEGVEEWEDGRVILDWVNAAGRVVARDTLVTMKGRDKKTRSAEMIVRSVEPDLVPLLRVEHLGLSGRMEIHSLQIIAVREREWVRWATVGLLGVWLFWSYGFVRMLTKNAQWRSVCIACLLLAMGWFLVVPGPWAHERPLMGKFQLVGAPEIPRSVDMSSRGGVAQDVNPLGEMPVQGSWLLMVKKALSHLRPVLHVLLFAGPAVVIAVLGGARCAWWCGVLASCAVEAAQAGFGFGFDWLDGVDLMVDWLGIGAAVWVYCWVVRKYACLR